MPQPWAWPIGSRYTHYAVPAHKTSNIRYNEHISYKRSNSLWSGICSTCFKKLSWLWPCLWNHWAGPTLHKMDRMNASENFHIQLHKCIFKVIKPIIRDSSLQLPEVTHDSQLCHACIYKIYILNYFILSAGLQVIPKPYHIQSKRNKKFISLT